MQPQTRRSNGGTNQSPYTLYPTKKGNIPKHAACVNREVRKIRKAKKNDVTSDEENAEANTCRYIALLGTVVMS